MNCSGKCLKEDCTLPIPSEFHSRFFSPGPLLCRTDVIMMRNRSSREGQMHLASLTVSGEGNSNPDHPRSQELEGLLFLPSIHTMPS